MANDYTIVDIPGIGQREIPSHVTDDQMDQMVQQIISLEGQNQATESLVDGQTDATAGLPLAQPQNLSEGVLDPSIPDFSIEDTLPFSDIGKQPDGPPPTWKEKIKAVGEVAKTLGTAIPKDYISRVKAIATDISKIGDPDRDPSLLHKEYQKQMESSHPFQVSQPTTATGKKYLDKTIKALSHLEGFPPGYVMPRVGVKMPSRVQSQAQLGLQAQKFYDQANKSGVQFHPDAFNHKIGNIAKGLRKEGYTPKAYKELSAVFNDAGVNTTFPKDFTEVQGIRKMFQNVAGSNDPAQARLAMKALDEFDDYMINAPQRDFLVAGKQGLEAWKHARQAYSRMKKSELFEDMIKTAQLKTSEGGNLDRTLLNDLTSLSKNKNKMKFFTPDEKARITKLVKSKDIRGVAQRIFSLGGLFAPGFGSRGGMLKTGGYAYGAGAYDPTMAIGVGTGTLLSRGIAEQMRKGGIRDLARFSRAGGSEILPGGKAYQIRIPTGSQYYGLGGILSGILEEDQRKQKRKFDGK